MRTLLALSMVVLLMAANSAEAGQRVALVLGNGAYKNIPTLPNAPISAQAMTRFLKGAGFDVMEGINLTRDKTTEKLLDFGKKAKGADIAVLFYAGQVYALGVNYLLPVDADIKSAMDLKLGAGLNLDLTLDETLSGAKVKLVFIDASRDNPFAESGAGPLRPFNSPIMQPADNTLSAYAAGIGQTAPDGPAGSVRPFTRALIANIAAAGIDIQQAMTKVRAEVSAESDGKQLPTVVTNLTREVRLSPTADK